MKRFLLGDFGKAAIATLLIVGTAVQSRAEDLVEAFEQPIRIQGVQFGSDTVESPRGKLDLERTDQELRAAEEAILGGVRMPNRSAPTISKPTLIVPVNNRSNEIPSEVIEALDSATAAGIVTPAQREMILPKQPSAQSAQDRYWEDSRPSSRQASPQNDKRLSQLEGENKDLRQDLQEMKDLLRDLQNTKDRLMVAETEVERLEKILSSRNTAALQLKTTPVKFVQKPTTRSASGEDSDLPIVTVQVDKANLRAAPGTQHSVIMEVGKGTRLVVETRKGDWYRVTTPNGKRAWVASEVVAFGPDSISSPSRTVKVKGYDDSIEELSYEQPRRGRSE